MTLTSDIKDFALDLGYSKVGIAPAAGFPDHVEAVLSRREHYGFFIDNPQRNFTGGADPAAGLMPSAKSIISLVYDYATCAFPEKLLRCIGRIYLARCYLAPPQRINGSRHSLFLSFLRQRGCEIGEVITLPERRAAARAGTATFGCNTFAYAEGSGSFIMLATFVVDKELEYDAPNTEIPCPPGCSACMKACPTGALHKPLHLNPYKCLAFNAWMNQEGRFPGADEHIPPEIREKMGTRVHGCDICQEACPRNKAKLSQQMPHDPFLDRIADGFSLPELLSLSDEFYRTRVQPIMYNYIKHKKYFQRNAAVALGNLGDPRHVPDLEAALSNTEELVRGYAAWGLGRIGGKEARAALERAHGREQAAFPLAEIRAALAR